MLLTTDPCGARLPRGKQTVLVRPRCAARERGHDHVIGIDAVGRKQRLAKRPPAIARFPPVERLAERDAGGGQHVEVEQAQLAEVQHDLGHAAGQKDVHRGMADGAVGQGIDQPRHLQIDRVPIVDRGASQSGGVGDRRDVQQQIGRAAEGRMHDHGVADRGVGQNVA